MKHDLYFLARPRNFLMLDHPFEHYYPLEEMYSKQDICIFIGYPLAVMTTTRE